jgi:fatty-acyl-CoA synthase
MVLPSSNLLEAIINILQKKKKITKANGVPTIWLGFITQ